MRFTKADWLLLGVYMSLLLFTFVIGAVDLPTFYKGRMYLPSLIVNIALSIERWGSILRITQPFYTLLCIFMLTSLMVRGKIVLFVAIIFTLIAATCEAYLGYVISSAMVKAEEGVSPVFNMNDIFETGISTTLQLLFVSGIIAAFYLYYLKHKAKGKSNLGSPPQS